MGAHTICRFVDRRFFLVDDEDRRALLYAIGGAHARWDWVWLSYAAMSSHVHYGHVAGVIDPDRFFRSAHTRFAKRYHHRRETQQTLGPVFADRPWIDPVRDHELSWMVTYHHRNPVEAGVVERPAQSTWTSHRAYLRLDPAPPWLDVERALDILGFSDTAAGRKRFDEFVMDVRLDERFWLETRPPVPQRAIRQSALDVDWPTLLELARDIAKVPASEPMSSRKRCVARARALVAHVATQDFGQPYAEVAAHLGVRTGSVGNLLTRQELAGNLEEHLAELRHRLSATSAPRIDWRRRSG